MGWTRAAKALVAVTALAMVATACGDDDDSEAASGDDTEAFCDIARELDAQEDFPSIEQLEEYRDTAPEEIREEAEFVAAEFIKATEAGDVFAAFEVEGMDEAFGDVIEPYETKECGIEHDDEEDEEEEDPSVKVLDPAAARVDVTATEYEFALTAPAVAGRTSFVMTNKGAERHVMYLFHVAEGKTVEDVMESEGDDGYDLDWESDTATAGEEAVLTADLVPGEYGLICYIANAEGKSHSELGMKETFTIQ
jgi:hypothetical protein